MAKGYNVSSVREPVQYTVTSALVDCDIADGMSIGLTTGCVTLYAPGPGVIKLGAGKRFV